MKTMLPILFSDPMVVAIIERRKQQTRRTRGLEEVPADARLLSVATVNGRAHATFERADGSTFFVKCPYGGPGGGLWVREAWAPGSVPFGPDAFWYRAGRPGGQPAPDRWHPSIHMPRTACRVEVDTKAIRVERLNDCSNEDAIAEGLIVERSPDVPFFRFAAGGDSFLDPVDAYRVGWETINGPGSWARNPWIWVVCFEPTVLPPS